MTDSKHYRTIVMSDIHLGTKWSKAKEANRFLKYHTCDTLILCGDVIDGWELLRGRREKWKRRHTNFIRRLRRGLPYYSVSQRIKQKVKASVSYISDFEEHLVRVAAQKGCSGVICGHIHQADKRMVGDILYLNSGDWVESLTALAEDYDGNWSILHYDAEE